MFYSIHVSSDSVCFSSCISFPELCLGQIEFLFNKADLAVRHSGENHGPENILGVQAGIHQIPTNDYLSI